MGTSLQRLATSHATARCHRAASSFRTAHAGTCDARRMGCPQTYAKSATQTPGCLANTLLGLAQRHFPNFERGWRVGLFSGEKKCFHVNFPLHVIFPCWIFPDGLFQLSILTLCFMAALLLEPVGGAQNFCSHPSHPLRILFALGGITVWGGSRGQRPLGPSQKITAQCSHIQGKVPLSAEYIQTCPSGMIGNYFLDMDS